MVEILTNIWEYFLENPLIGWIMLLTVPIYDLIHRGLIRTGKLRWTGALRETLLLLFVLYCAGILAVTFLPFELTFSPSYTFRSALLETVQGTYTAGSWHWTMWLSNLALFFPFGLFVSLLWQRTAGKTLALSLGTILCVEVLQPFAGRSFDVDDILLNFLGAEVGIGLAMGLKALFPGIKKKLAG